MINWFDDFNGPNPNGFLSNFYVGAPIRMGKLTYRTGEHAFAAYKAAEEADHNYVRGAVTPGQAKQRGRTIPLRHDWEVIKYDVMRWVLASKFHLAREEAGLLLATGDELLVEGTHWRDRVWGVDLNATTQRVKPGRNWLGHLLMAQRAILRSGEHSEIDTTEIMRFIRRAR